MCLFPFNASIGKTIDKATGFIVNEPGIKIHHDGDIVLPCGKCVECLTQRSQEWALRAAHEMSCHNDNCFVTLTYNDEHLPSIEKFKQLEDFQLFMKNLRYSLGKKKIKYMASHEFGGKTFRPHHHLIIFGWNPANQKFLKTTPKGYRLYTSTHLEKQWENGYSSVAEANAQTAFYVASYALKGKIHTYIDNSGEIITVRDHMTSSNGIGLQYAKKNLKQLVDSKKHIPRYYKKKLFEENPTLHEQFDERESSKNPKIKSASEKYAKYIITEQKQTNQNDQLRSLDKNKIHSEHQKYRLKQLRDNQVSKKPEE